MYIYQALPWPTGYFCSDLLSLTIEFICKLRWYSKLRSLCFSLTNNSHTFVSDQGCPSWHLLKNMVLSAAGFVSSFLETYLRTPLTSREMQATAVFFQIAFLLSCKGTYLIKENLKAPGQIGIGVRLSQFRQFKKLPYCRYICVHNGRRVSPAYCLSSCIFII